MKKILLLIIRAYQLILSPVLGSNCRYYPTCSSYAHIAIHHHGAIKGSWLALKRILRCHPWAASGLDPVPGVDEDPLNFYFHDCQAETESLETAVVNGLRQSPKQLPPKLFYDIVGSKIFDRICDQPEYYLPDAELRIYDKYVDEIVECIGEDSHIIELGAGSCNKIRSLLEHIKPAMYVPMDISAEHLRSSAKNVAEDYPDLDVHAICVDHTLPYTLPSEVEKHKRIFFYPSSSLGNFRPKEAISFLHDLRSKAGKDGGLLIGIDTKKPTEVLNLAYNDAAGATADLNLNLLERINEELSADIDVNSFSHHAFYNKEKSRMEMHLVSKKAQSIVINNESFQFKKGESIHTENSYKYSVEEFQSLSQKAGWKCNKVWQDGKKYFAVYFFSRI